jgi:bla regulator protein blaR1
MIARAFVLAAAACVAFGQPAALPRFEVVSIKPNAQAGSDIQGNGDVRFLPGGRLSTERASLRYIIQNAYGVKPFQLIGGPGWIDSAHYDIDAKAPTDARPAEMRLMMQAMLEDRFQLKAHRESRELPVYELTAAKSGVKLEPPKPEGCTPPRPCGRVLMTISGAGARLEGAQVPMAEFVRVLSNVLARTVVDKTGFSGLFDVRLDFAPDQTLGGLPAPAGSDDPRVPSIPADPNHPTIFTAMQQQLGIKVEAAKGPVEVIIIDRVERPAGN